MRREHVSDLFICTDRPKSWASAFDYASKIVVASEVRVKILLLSNDAFVFKSHFFRDKTLKQIAIEKNLDFHIIKFQPRWKVSSSIRAIVFVFGAKFGQNWTRLPFKDEARNLICKAYWGAKFGSRNFILHKLSVFDLFTAVYKCDLYRRFYNSRLGRRIIEESVDTVTYIWNGREPAEASLLLPLLTMGRPYRIIERGASRDTYEFWESSPHSPLNWWSKLEENWKRLAASGISAQDRLLAFNYADAKSKGFDPRAQKNWLSMMGKRIRISNNTAPYIVFFSSSTKELSPFAEFEPKSPFGDQFGAVASLIEIAKKCQVDLIIRRHPNSVSKDGTDYEKLLWQQFACFPNVKVIQPEEEFDSYQIAEKALCSYVWISSIGFDLIYKGLNVRALGPAFWAYKKSFRAFDERSVVESFTREIGLEERNELVINYGNLMATAGQSNNLFRNISKAGVMVSSSNKTISASDWLYFKRILRGKSRN